MFIVQCISFLWNSRGLSSVWHVLFYIADYVMSHPVVKIFQWVSVHCRISRIVMELFFLVIIARTTSCYYYLECLDGIVCSASLACARGIYGWRSGRKFRSVTPGRTKISPLFSPVARANVWRPHITYTFTDGAYKYGTQYTHWLAYCEK